MLRTIGVRLIWTPRLDVDTNTLSIQLDREFANLCADYRLTDEQAFTEMTWLALGKAVSAAPHRFMDMYNGSLLLNGLYMGSNGVWINLDPAAAEFDMNAPVRYVA